MRSSHDFLAKVSYYSTYVYNGYEISGLFINVILLSREENLATAAFRTVEKSIKGEHDNVTCSTMYSKQLDASTNCETANPFDLSRMCSQRPFNCRMA